MMKKTIALTLALLCLISASFASPAVFAADRTYTLDVPSRLSPLAIDYYQGDDPIRLETGFGQSGAWVWYVNGVKQPAENTGDLSWFYPDTDTTGTYTLYAEITVTTTGRIPQTVKQKSREVVITVHDAPAFDFRVNKTDEKGAPLAGAILQLVGADADTAGNYEGTTNSEGYVIFSAARGTYTLSEKTAPVGYAKSADAYTILIGGENEIFVIHAREETRYEPVTFVNTKTADETRPTETQTFQVRKTDEGGAPLAGAIIRLEGKTPDGIPRVYDETTDSRGLASFTAERGSFTLSEYAAPTGYNASDSTYRINVAENGVFFADANGRNGAPYGTVTFVNKPIPVLNKDDHFSYMLGYPDGTFGPSRNMTRAETVVMFSRLTLETIDLSADYKNDGYYPDDDMNAWYANQVCYMHKAGVLADYSRDGKLRPNDPVTRAEFATLAAHFDNLVPTGANKFKDVSDTHWAVKYINSAAAKGWIAGYPDGTFKPEANITRAEVVTLVNRILERKADQSYINANPAALPRAYADLEKSHWAYWDIMEASVGHDYIKNASGETWTAVYE